MTQFSVDTIAAAQSQLPPNFPIIWKNDVGWDQARVGRVFNLRRPSRQPLAVVQASREKHIVAAVQLANTIGCRVSVRSGGHSWAAWSVRDGAILIDMGKYHDFSLDEKTNVLQVSPSMTGRLVNTLLSQRGRMFPGGHCPDVGLGGFLLQGGMGWNCKNWGWACERLVGLDVVTSAGEKKYCDKQTNSDLFWAARGAGPGFPAIVTGFHLQTLPAFTHMRSSIYIYKIVDYEIALSWIVKLAEDYDERVEIVAVGQYVKGLEGPHITVKLVTFTNSEEEARAALQGAEDTVPGNPVIRIFSQETSLAEEYDDQRGANPEGHGYTVDNCFIRNDADVVSVLKESFTTLPTKKSFSLWYSMAPGSRRSFAHGTMEDMALSMQTDHYFAAYTVSEDATENSKCHEWTQRILRQMEPHAEGGYLGDSDFQVRQTMYWGSEQGRRLMEVRRKWDPQGLVCGFLDDGDRSRTQGLANTLQQPRL